MYLLGAGASKEAGVPTTIEMTDCIVDALTGTTREVVLFVLGGLLFQRGVTATDPRKGIDVEELFAAVELLARRHTLEAAPFIGAWHSRVDELDRVMASPGVQIQNVARKIYEMVVAELERSLPRSDSSSARQIDNALAQSTRTSRAGRSVTDAISGFARDWMSRAGGKRPRGGLGLDSAFSAAVTSSQAKPGAGTIFETTANAMIGQLKSLVWVQDSNRTEHLEPLIKEAERQGRMSIATLNYDNCIERTAEAFDVPFHTGLTGWSQSGVFEFPESGLALLKLHGSIDWVVANSESDDRPMPQPIVRTASAEEVESGNYEPAVVFGLGNKLQAQGPYLDLLQQFRRELASAGQVVIIGYSFRDSHVNHYLTTWINEDAARDLIVIDPNFTASEVPYAQQLRSRLGSSARLTIHAEPAGDALKKIALCG